MIAAVAIVAALTLAGAEEAKPAAEEKPGYEFFDKKTLWQLSVDFEGKYRVAATKLAGCELEKQAASPEAVKAIAAGATPRAEDSGMTTGAFAGWIAVAAAAGIIVGVFVLAPKVPQPSTVVVR